MLRWAEAVATITVTAILLALFEPTLAMSDTARLLFIILLLALVRSPLWLSRIVAAGRAGST